MPTHLAYKLSSLFLFLLHSNLTIADHKANAESAFDTLQGWYNQSSGLWDTASWWQSANCMTTLGSLAAVDSEILSVAESVWANTLQNAPQGTYAGFKDDYYDDEGWWALAWIQAYDVTKDETYLETAISIFDDMTYGSNTSCGGIWWDKQHTYVNSIANELFMSVAAHLVNRPLSTAPSSDRDIYLNLALYEWHFLDTPAFMNEDHLFNDGLTNTCTNNNGTIWTYNQGVVLGGLVELYKATQDQSYLDEAYVTATSAVNYLTNLTDGVLIETSCGAAGCDGDALGFKGIFMRNLAKLSSALQEDDWKNFISKNADSIWNNDRDLGDNLGLLWGGPYQNATAITQSSALDCIVAAVALDV